MIESGVICFLDKGNEYKMECLESDYKIVLEIIKSFYERNSLDDIRNFFKKIIWITDDDCRHITDELKRFAYISDYDKSNLLCLYIKSQDLFEVKERQIKGYKRMKNLDKAIIYQIYKTKEERKNLKEMLRNYMLDIDKNFEEINGELHLKLFNNGNIDETKALYKISIDMDKDRLVIYVKEGMQSYTIDNRNFNVKLIEKERVM